MSSVIDTKCASFPSSLTLQSIFFSSLFGFSSHKNVLFVYCSNQPHFPAAIWVQKVTGQTNKVSVDLVNIAQAFTGLKGRRFSNWWKLKKKKDEKQTWHRLKTHLLSIWTWMCKWALMTCQMGFSLLCSSQLARRTAMQWTELWKPTTLRANISFERFASVWMQEMKLGKIKTPDYGNTSSSCSFFHSLQIKKLNISRYKDEADFIPWNWSHFSVEE